MTSPVTGKCCTTVTHSQPLTSSGFGSGAGHASQKNRSEAHVPMEPVLTLSSNPKTLLADTFPALPMLPCAQPHCSV